VTPVDLAGGVEHVRVHAGSDEVEHVHAGAVELAPERLAERHHAGLGRRVGGRCRKPGVAADARVVHDGAAAALDHPREKQLREVHEAHEVHLEHRVDVVGLLLLEQAAGHEAGVVHEQLHPREAGSALLYGLARGEVELDVADLARAAGRRGGRIGRVAAHPAEEQAERALRELLGDGPADPAARAGHERGLSL